MSLGTILPLPAFTLQLRKPRHDQREPGPGPRLPLESFLRYHLEVNPVSGIRQSDVNPDSATYWLCGLGQTTTVCPHLCLRFLICQTGIRVPTSQGCDENSAYNVKQLAENLEGDERYTTGCCCCCCNCYYRTAAQRPGWAHRPDYLRHRAPRSLPAPGRSPPSTRP